VKRPKQKKIQKISKKSLIINESKVVQKYITHFNKEAKNERYEKNSRQLL
jgi:hypothetical protein